MLSNFVVYNLEMLAALLAISIGFADLQVNSQPRWWIFLEPGKVSEPADKGVTKKMMKGHLGNFTRLLGTGDLAAAGPTADPTGVIEGIVVLNVKTRKDVDRCFLPDPFVQAGMLKIHAVPIKVLFGKLNRVLVDPNHIEEGRMVVFKLTGQPHVGSDLLNFHSAPGLAFFASCGDGSQIGLFRGKDEPAINEWLKTYPLVRFGELKPTIYPQYFAKGVLGG